MAPSAVALLAAVVLVANHVIAMKSYTGHQVIRVTPNLGKELELLHTLEQNELLDFWRHPSTIGRPVDIRISPSQMNFINKTLSTNEVDWIVAIKDVQEWLDGFNRSRLIGKRAQADILSTFAEESDIQTWLAGVANSCGSRCTLLPFGTSVEGREMKVIKVTGSGTAPPNGKPAVFVDGGIHAREWISPVVVNNMINSLINDYDTDDDVKAMLDAYDWYLIPLLNPDGYAYSHNSDRLWRKNRAPTSRKRCVGVDLNRNFGYHYGEDGVSSNPCSEIYLGTGAFSEPESAALRDFLAGINLEVYFTFHSYGQYILFPWGYGRVYADNHDDMEDVAQVGARAIKSTNGEDYTVGTAAMALYPAAGGSDDWAKGGAGATYSYTFELPPNDQDGAGFELPENRIPEVISSTWPGVKAMMNRILVKKTEPMHLGDKKPTEELPSLSNGIFHGNAWWKKDLRQKFREYYKQKLKLENNRIPYADWVKKYDKHLM